MQFERANDFFRTERKKVAKVRDAFIYLLTVSSASHTASLTDPPCTIPIAGAEAQMAIENGCAVKI